MKWTAELLAVRSRLESVCESSWRDSTVSPSCSAVAQASDQVLPESSGVCWFATDAPSSQAILWPRQFRILEQGDEILFADVFHNAKNIKNMTKQNA